ncbi:MAG: hypothetical protein ACAI34_10515 [Verrucomicrobium sp.]
MNSPRTKSRSNPFAIVFVLLSILPASASAQGSESPALVNLREGYLRAMQRASIPVLAEYVRQLESEKSALTRQGKLDQVQAVEAELGDAASQLKVAKEAVARPGAVLRLTILSGRYGDFATGRVVDITKTLREALDARSLGISLHRDGAAKGIDPAPLVAKQTSIVYSINGERKEKVFAEGHNLNFKSDLQ